MTSQVLQVRTCTQVVTTALLMSNPSFLCLVTARSSAHAPLRAQHHPRQRGSLYIQLRMWSVGGRRSVG